jgi:hypothetical protein
MLIVLLAFLCRRNSLLHPVLGVVHHRQCCVVYYLTLSKKMDFASEVETRTVAFSSREVVLSFIQDCVFVQSPA